MFVALDLPPDARAGIAEWRDRAVGGRAELRAVASQSLHLTLCFLGWRAQAQAPAIAATAFGACAGLTAPLLAPGRVVALPPRRPRLFALELRDRGAAAVELQAAVSGALAAAGLHEPEARPFWPHLTLARVRRGLRAEPLQPPPAPAIEFRTGDLTLYRSTLHPQGALYEPLSRTRLES